MNKYKKCPACLNSNLSEKDIFCNRCGWEFHLWIIAPSAEERNRYEKRLEIARNNWNELEEHRKAKEGSYHKTNDQNAKQITNSVLSIVPPSTRDNNPFSPLLQKTSNTDFTSGIIDKMLLNNAAGGLQQPSFLLWI